MKEIADILRSYFKEDEIAIKQWLYCENIRFKGQTPMDLINSGGFRELHTYCIHHLIGKTYERPQKPSEDKLLKR